MADSASQPVSVLAIAPEQTHRLRHTVLRPHQTLAQMVYEGDDAPKTLHLGAFEGPPADGDEPVGIVTLQPAPMPGDDQAGDWRLRGMAVAADRQGRGVGQQIVEQSIQAVRQRGGQRLWANARVTAMGFYTRLGFSFHGEPFEIEGIGPHYVMSIAIDPDPR